MFSVYTYEKLSSVHTRAEYAAENGHLFTEKNIFLFFKWPSLRRIMPRNTLCVNSPLGRVEEPVISGQIGSPDGDREEAWFWQQFCRPGKPGADTVKLFFDETDTVATWAIPFSSLDRYQPV